VGLMNNSNFKKQILCMIATLLSFTVTDFRFIINPSIYSIIGIGVFLFSKTLASTDILNKKLKDYKSDYSGFNLYVYGLIAAIALSNFNVYENVSHNLALLRNSVFLIIPMYSGFTVGINSIKKMTKDQMLRYKHKD
jgi:uncharacterized membrane protein